MRGTMMDFPLTLPTLLDRAGRLFPRVEIVSRRPDLSIHRSNYGEFHRRARRLASALTKLGLQPGDRVLLYTDGVFEAMNAAQVEYSKPRLEKFLAANTDLSADKFANALLDDVNVWSDDPNGRSQDDDITLVVLDIDTPNQAPV